MQVVQRDFGFSTNDTLASREPLRLFSAMLDAAAIGTLDQAWTKLWRPRSQAVLGVGWPGNRETTWSRIQSGLGFLGFPREAGPKADDWCRFLSASSDDLAIEDRFRLQAYMLRTALDEESDGTWRLCAMVLPGLRPAILTGSLPVDVYQMLERDLPRFNTAPYWDLDRRILTALSFLIRKNPGGASKLAIGLAEHDLWKLRNAAEEEEESKKSRFFWF